MSNQSGVHAAVRAITGTSLDYNSDWSALFDAHGIAAGDWNGRMLAWINQTLGASFPDVQGAMNALAANQGNTNFSAMDGLSMALLPSVYVAGRWYLPDSLASVMSAGLAFGTANVLRLFPAFISRAVTISDLACFVSTADTGKNIQIGIYASSPTTAYPTTLVGRTASITLTGTGVKSAALSGGNTVLRPGLYWFAVNSDSTAVVCVRYASAAPYGPICIGSTTAANVIGNGTQLLALTTPDTFGTWTADITSNVFTELTGSTYAAVAFKAV
jgi:hypothetical protein